MVFHLVSRTRHPTPSEEERLRLRFIAVLIAAAALAVPATAGAAKGARQDDVRVMSRNVYLGSSLDPALAAPTLGDAVRGAGQIYNEIERTNFPERAVLLANEIKDAKAHLVGLQEVALWQEESPSNGGGPPITNAPAATNVKYDFLRLLMNRLGRKYRVVGSQQEFQGELPADTDGDGDADLDIRLTMNDVIVARDGVETKNVKSGNYENRFETDVGGVPVAADRGWVSTKANVDGTRFKFVNTHLEAFGDPRIRARQARELVRGPADSDKDVVLVGDMNSDKDDTGGDNKAYDVLRNNKFVVRQARGNTSGHDESLTDPNDQDEFRRKIDYVFVNDRDIRLVRDESAITGVTGPMSPSGLWPSDHAGVFSTLRFP
jgi:endonuclease/exonuclease/phosphatase family metal-dependent hydrolase